MFLLLTLLWLALPHPVTIHVAGDSTSAPKLVHKRPETGWGEQLAQHFEVDRVRVTNHARNGRSTRSFVAEGRWEALLREVRPGDYVFIQFGHNDAAENRPDRYTPPEQYRALLTQFVQDVYEREAHPVLFTSVARRRFSLEGQFYDAHGVYPEIVREVARDTQTPLIDHHVSSVMLMRELGDIKTTCNNGAISCSAIFLDTRCISQRA
jgi:lysophospholipase L1-like esterase